MSASSHNHHGIGSLFCLILLCIHIGIFLLLCISGYGCLFHPDRHPWLVSAGLAFGPVLLAYCLCSLLWLFLRPRRFLSSLAGILVCGIPVRTYFPLNITQDDMDASHIKVVSYNVNDFSKNNALRRTEIFDFIHSCDADIVCLQEANYLPSERRMMDSIMSPWAYRDTTMFYFNTLSLYTHLPILDKCIVHGPDSPHGAVIYRLKKDGDTIVVINCHFFSNSISGDDKAMFKDVVKQPAREETKSNIHYLARKIDEAGISRAHQADALLEYLHLFSHQPVILCGDFNDSPLSYVHRCLTSVLNDSYTRGGNGPGISYHEAGMYFRIDHILCSPHWDILKSKVRSDIKGSDHYPICSWLMLK